VDDYKARLDRLASAAAGKNRDLASLELSLEIEILIGPDRATVRQIADGIAALPAAGPARARADLVSFLQTTDPVRDWQLPASYEERVLVGTPDEIVDRIRQYQALGVSHFLLWFLDFPSLRGIELFAERVGPGIR
jgi:alkanesulfonate monooxygenase SsuD/methylene tetrahydromethanopterin reductase-like flavin-dependent oxidoreductase (luciferase family)